MSSIVICNEKDRALTMKRTHFALEILFTYNFSQKLCSWGYLQLSFDRGWTLMSAFFRDFGETEMPNIQQVSEEFHLCYINFRYQMAQYFCELHQIANKSSGLSFCQ